MSMFSKTIKEFPPQLIIIPPDRQRSGGDSIDTSDIEPSIAKRGVMHPVIIKRNMELVAGERRLRAVRKLQEMTGADFSTKFGYPKPTTKIFEKIPTRYFEELSSREAKIVELEENERRKDLEWRDHVRALVELHSLYEEEAAEAGDSWSIERSGDMLNYNKTHLGKCLRIARDIDNPKIANAPGLAAAYNILAKIDERKIADAMNSIQDIGRTLGEPPMAPPVQLPISPELSLESIGLIPAKLPIIATTPALIAAPRPESILLEDFIEWSEAYSGPRFNFIHCDFPYGANVFGGPQSGRDKWTTYDDNPDVYWALIRAFCKNRDKFMLPSAHLMFWYSIDFHSDTIKLFSELAPELSFNPKPLIWTKSDNVGIISDPQRGPRHVYETCLFASREDRRVIQSISDSYACPTDKAWHPSTKPVPMLSHFMRMFVDEHTEMLDPTCGSGSSLRAAEALGAKRVLGLERDAEFADGARVALKQDRAKRILSKR